MIVVQARNRHNAYGHLLGLLCGPRAKLQGSIFIPDPVCIDLARPDEVVDILPGLMLPPHKLMFSLLQLGSMKGTAQLREPMIQCEQGDFDKWTTASFGLTNGAKEITASACVQQMHISDIFSVLARLGFQQQLFAEDMLLGIGHAIVVINRVWAMPGEVDERRPYLTLPRKEQRSFYDKERVDSVAILGDVSLRTFIEDCRAFLYDGLRVGLRSSWLRRIAQPVVAACEHVDNTGNMVEAEDINAQCIAPEWRAAVSSYIQSHPLRADVQ